MDVLLRARGASHEEMHRGVGSEDRTRPCWSDAPDLRTTGRHADLRQVIWHERQPVEESAR